MKTLARFHICKVHKSGILMNDIPSDIGNQNYFVILNTVRSNHSNIKLNYTLPS